MRHLLPALALALAACATGDSIISTSSGPSSGPGGGDGGASSSGEGGASSSRSSSTSGSTTASSTTSTTTSTSALASSSSTGTPCAQDPCQLILPQCGCDAGEMCTLVGAGGERGCDDAGTRTPGQQCGGSNGECAAGGVCVYLSGTGNTKLSCSAFCESDAQCDGQGSWCALGLSGVDDIKLCSTNCDPVTSTGCPIIGTKCTLGRVEANDRFFTICSGTSGGGGQFAACTASENCAAGFECLETTNGDNVCFQWCSTANPNCPSGLSCQQFTPPATIGGVSYGVCSG